MHVTLFILIVSTALFFYFVGRVIERVIAKRIGVAPPDSGVKIQGS